MICTGIFLLRAFSLFTCDLLFLFTTIWDEADFLISMLSSILCSSVVLTDDTWDNLLRCWKVEDALALIPPLDTCVVRFVMCDVVLVVGLAVFGGGWTKCVLFVVELTELLAPFVGPIVDDAVVVVPGGIVEP